MKLRGLVATIALLAACRGGRSDGPTVRESVEGRFPHQRHAALACTACHDGASVARGVPATPGARDHAPCDDSGCHRERFLEAPGPLCSMCHRPDEDRVAPGGPLVYPPAVGPRALASRFSHQTHLDYGAMERAVGFHVACSDCHVANEAGELTRPGHAVCNRCHAPEAAPTGAPVMTACEDCHRPHANPPSRLPQVITGDLHFQHANHRADRGGTGIRCTECHVDAAEVRIEGQHTPPPTSACVTCHDDSSRVATPMRMRVCETCHATKSKTLAQLPPRSHLPAPRRPADHTLAFRHDHGVEAKVDAQRCARCHTFMSGSNHDTCDECHRTMRPMDHAITWNEYEHGPEARAHPDRCATCHQTDFCVACHSRPPRSHFPLMEFRSRGHGQIARFEMRACVTCHEPARDCMGSGCHVVRPRP